MKSLIYIIALAVASFSIVACNNGNKSNSGKDTKASASSSGAAATSAKPDADSKTPASVKALVSNYLQLKNALAKDNSSDAATAGTALADGFEKFDKSTLTATQKKSFEDIADDAKEMAQHIGKSAGKLPHQREHFDMLSKDMYDLVKLFGAGQPLYVDHCPKYNDKKGADWLSETKDIKNPYMGSAMSTCGSVKEELK
ncbi:MAG: cobalt transporter [Mucilaginibacter sp.]|nr:cobalt transporter [Mucilaginibacter sp.]